MVSPTNVLTVKDIAFGPKTLNIVQPYLWTAFAVDFTAQAFGIFSENYKKFKDKQLNHPKVSQKTTRTFSPKLRYIYLLTIGYNCIRHMFKNSQLQIYYQRR